MLLLEESRWVRKKKKHMTPLGLCFAFRKGIYVGHVKLLVGSFHFLLPPPEPVASAFFFSSAVTIS
jgi:hypothetical protein